jgi:lipooligosaccharide transport system ATP-binding protein
VRTRATTVARVRFRFKERLPGAASRRARRRAERRVGSGGVLPSRLLTAQAIADAGELEILGLTLPGESKVARAQMGVVPQADNLDVTLTVEQNLLVFTHLYRIGRAERRAAIDRALDIANLRERRAARVDEPTVGLDPQVRQELWALIDRLRSEGVSILMSTHYIEEAERLADTVVVVSKGKHVAVGRPGDLVAEHAGREALEVYGLPARLREVEADARGRGWPTRRTGTSVTILRAEGIVDSDAPEGERRTANLEDVFVLLTGEEIS